MGANIRIKFPMEVELLDVNDNPPVFTKSMYQITVLETVG